MKISSSIGIISAALLVVSSTAHADWLSKPSLVTYWGQVSLTSYNHPFYIVGCMSLTMVIFNDAGLEKWCQYSITLGKLL